MFAMPSQRADLAVAAITLTTERRESVDFTTPYDESENATTTFLIKKGTGGGAISTLDELVDVPGIAFGIIPSSSYEVFFKAGTTEINRKIWKIAQVSDVIFCTHWIEDEIHCGEYTKEFMGYRLGEMPE